MISRIHSRRSFILGVGAAAATTVAASSFLLSRGANTDQSIVNCNPNACFSDDYLQYGYAANIAELYERARQGRLQPIASGQSINESVAVAFGANRLHHFDARTIQTERLDREYNFLAVRCDLDCGVPIVGILAYPSNPIGLVSIAHGSATTPYRLFDRQSPDYMNAIGAKLLDENFAVWVPFQQHAGNMPSTYNIASVLAANSLSYINVSCSAVAMGPALTSIILERPFSFVSRFGMSGGFYTVLYLAAALDDAPFVAAGEPPHDRQWVQSKYVQEHAGSYLPPVFWMMPQFRPLFFPAIGSLVTKSTAFFEIGLASTEQRAGYEAVLDEFDSLRGKSSERVFHENAHRVDGIEAVKWLRGLAELSA